MQKFKEKDVVVYIPGHMKGKYMTQAYLLENIGIVYRANDKFAYTMFPGSLINAQAVEHEYLVPLAKYLTIGEYKEGTHDY